MLYKMSQLRWNFSVLQAAQQPLQAPVVCLKGLSQYVIRDGSVGHTYERILVDYIDVYLTKLRIEDGYLLEKHQGMRKGTKDFYRP